MPGRRKPGGREPGGRFAGNGDGIGAASIRGCQLARCAAGAASDGVRRGHGVYARVKKRIPVFLDDDGGEPGFVAADREDPRRTIADGFGDYSFPSFACSRRCVAHSGILFNRAGRDFRALRAVSFSSATAVGLRGGIAGDFSGWAHPGGQWAGDYFGAAANTFPMDESRSFVDADGGKKLFAGRGLLDRAGDAAALLDALSDAAGNSRNNVAGAADDGGGGNGDVRHVESGAPAGAMGARGQVGEPRDCQGTGDPSDFRGRNAGNCTAFAVGRRDLRRAARSRARATIRIDQHSTVGAGRFLVVGLRSICRSHRGFHFAAAGWMERIG